MRARACVQVYLIHEGEWCIHRSIEAHSKTGASQGQRYAAVATLLSGPSPSRHGEPRAQPRRVGLRRAVQVCTMNGPAFVGDMELLLGESVYSCTCVAKTHTVYYSLHIKDFLQIPSQVRSAPTDARRVRPTTQSRAVGVCGEW